LNLRTDDRKALVDAACHEAGHAVIALHLGISVVEASVDASNSNELIDHSGARGYVRVAWETEAQTVRRADGRYIAARRRCMVLYAGVEAMAIRWRRTPRDIDWIRHGIRDIRDAEADLNLVAHCEGGPADRHLLTTERRIRAATRSLLREFQPFTDALATALLDRPTLTGNEIVRIVQDAPVDEPLRARYFSTPDREMATHSWELTRSPPADQKLRRPRSRREA